ncbi:MAG: hypothetical protein HC780_13425 [Leptolyngbyaceae cyanobacterium CSU_1_3]|nr:hypothetical protein [Leptolyngbyaceae cyanobacterium CSU_1_3]
MQLKLPTLRHIEPQRQHLVQRMDSRHELRLQRWCNLRDNKQKQLKLY